ncbi:alpha-glucoside ABC transporter permease, partial [Rhizobium leguminosarum]
GDSGRSAVIAIIIMLAVTPIMVWNVLRANRELKGH